MDCCQVHKYLDDLLAVENGETVPEKALAHIQACPSCAREYELARQTLAFLQPSQEIHPSSELKERIMNAIIALGERNSRHAVSRPLSQPRRSNLRRPAWVLAAVALLTVLASVNEWLRPAKEGRAPMPAFSLLSQARAAEEALFVKEGIVHLVNEIEVKAVSNPDLANVRWIPLMSLDATGKARDNQLTLPAQPGEGYTVSDQSWYDPHAGRFARLLTLKDKPVFASSYDGEGVYSLDTATTGVTQVARNSISPDFNPPRSPAEFLGMAAGLPSGLRENDKSLVSDVSQTTLSDGSKGRIVRVVTPGTESKDQKKSCWLFTIRENDNTIAQMEWIAEGESMLVIRRILAETVEKPGIAWTLADIPIPPAPPSDAPKIGVSPDAVVTNVSVRHMVEKADFETYIFATDPPWAGQCQIADVLDVASPPHRMFHLVYPAQDRRHVVFIQSYTYNMALGPKVKKGRLVYESPKGFKVWSGQKDKWLAGILLQSSRYVFADPPVEDCTGYVIETPARTFPALAINGQVTDDELHALIDSLVPTKEYKGK